MDMLTDPTVMFFDQYQRYHTAAELIRTMQAVTMSGERTSLVEEEGRNDTEVHVAVENSASIRILEVGANEHRDLGKELPDAEIFYTDLHLPESMRDDDHCFQADATDLREVPDGSYDFCVALDVFEHVPKERRKQFLTEIHRVCGKAAVISFPYNAPEVEQAERDVNDMYRELFGDDHPWLTEHMENGLPDRKAVETILQDAKIPFSTFTHGSVAVWKRMLVLNYFADEDAFSDLVTQTNLYYNRKVYPRDTACGNLYPAQNVPDSADMSKPHDSVQNNSGVDYRAFYIFTKTPLFAEKIKNPFAGLRLSDADVIPIDDALKQIAG